MPRYIKHVEPITLLDLITGGPIAKDKEGTPDDPWDFHRFVARFFFVDPKIGSGRAAGKAISRLNRALARPAESGYYVVDESDWELLKRIASEPTEPEKSWPIPMIVSQLEPFFEAIEEATTTPPAPAVAAS